MMPLTWAAAGVNVLRWRSMATFTILPGSHIRPLVLSPGGACISYNRTHRYVSFQSHPVAVAGTYGAGRFALFGGPHAFETGQLGLLAETSNARFLENVVRWLCRMVLRNWTRQSPGPARTTSPCGIKPNNAGMTLHTSNQLVTARKPSLWSNGSFWKVTSFAPSACPSGNPEPPQILSKKT